MNNIKKMFISVLLFFLLFPFVKAIEGDEVKYNYINQQTNYTAKIEDDASLLTESEKDKVFEEIKPLTQFGHIAFKTINTNSYYSTENYVRTYYHENYGVASGTVFIIDMAKREIYVFSDGNNYNIITSSKAYSITDNVYKYATNADYYNCASKAFKDINNLLVGEKINEPMRLICNVIISITLAFFIGFIIVFFKYKIKKTSNGEIIKKIKSDFKINQINAVQIGTHRVYNPPSDSSSGGSSGGGSSGGGSSGGGGGHSF